MTDKNWNKVFTEVELNDIKNEGGLLEFEVPEELQSYYSDLNGVVCICNNKRLITIITTVTTSTQR